MATRARRGACRLARLCEDLRRTPHPATAHGARVTLVYEFHARGAQCGNELHQGIHRTPDYTFTAFHALDRRHRQLRRVRQGALVHAEQGACRPQLCCGDQDERPGGVMCQIGIMMYGTLILVFCMAPVFAAW